MTSKSKEAYRVLQKAWALRKDSEDYPDFDDINEALYTIKQDLERKEQLEKENQELKAKLGFEKTLSNNQCLAVLKLANENQELKKAYTSVNEELHCAFARGIDSARFDVLEENQKLKKAIEILKDKSKLILKNDNGYYIECGKYGYLDLTQQEYELLREVLGNE